MYRNYLSVLVLTIFTSSLFSQSPANPEPKKAPVSIGSRATHYISDTTIWDDVFAIGSLKDIAPIKENFGKFILTLINLRSFPLLRDTDLKQHLEHLKNLVHTIQESMLLEESLTLSMNNEIEELIKDLYTFMQSYSAFINAKKKTVTESSLKALVMELQRKSVALLEQFSQSLVSEIQNLYTQHDLVMKRAYVDFCLTWVIEAPKRLEQGTLPEMYRERVIGIPPGTEEFIRKVLKDMRHTIQTETIFKEKGKKHFTRHMKEATRLLLEGLERFDQKTIRLLNNSACRTYTTMGRLPDTLILKIFKWFEDNKSLKAFIEQVCLFYNDKDELYSDFMLVLQRYICCAYSEKQELKNSAKGFLWEIAVGYHFAYHLRTARRDHYEHALTSLNCHLAAENRSYEFDCLTSRYAIECKNLTWSRFDCSQTRSTSSTSTSFTSQQDSSEYDKFVTKLRGQKSALTSTNTTKNLKRKMLIISVTQIPHNIVQFLNNQEIEYVDCSNHAQATRILPQGFQELFNQFDAHGNFIDR